MLGLYIHVPFCVKKCIYCDFYSIPLSQKDDINIKEKYIAAVIKNIRRYAQKYDTVYFGGGTPSLLSASEIYSVLNSADISSYAEISLECNPETISKNKLEDYLNAGINRISFGVQTLDNNELKMLGRIHDSDTAINAINTAYNVGFENISADLMLGLPYQTASTVTSNANTLASLPITHISAYMLKVEDKTPLAYNSKLCSAIDDDLSADYYEIVAESLEKKGLKRYEISNFAKSGFECKHNLKYWLCDDYIGIGPSAHSCYNNKRYAVLKDIGKFIASDVQNEYITDENPCTDEEKLMLKMRTSVGICKSDFAQKYDSIIKKASPLIKAGFIENIGDRLALTTKGCLVSNEVIVRLCEGLY